MGTVSPQIRIVALAGLVLALVGGGAMMLLGRSSPDTTSPPARHTTRPAATTPAATTPKTATTPKSATKPSAHATAKPTTHAKTHAKTHTATKTPAKNAHKKVVRGNLVDARLPAALQWQLSQHKVVVVSLYNPRSDVDAISVAEAHAGAVDAKVGFLLVSVLDDKVAGMLTALLPGGGLLPDPGVLVYRAPGTLAYRFDGFLDRDSVAQAAANATAGQTDPSVADPHPDDGGTTTP